MNELSLENTIGRDEIKPPEGSVPSVGAEGKPRTFKEASAATSFVTAAVPLLCSDVPTAGSGEMGSLMTDAFAPGWKTILPRMSNA